MLNKQSFNFLHNFLLQQANRQLQKDPTTEIQQLQEELIACKLREAEATLSMKELRTRVNDLEKYWHVGIHVINSRLKNRYILSLEYHKWDNI